MSVFEYDEERHLAYILEKGRREGREEGRKEERIKLLVEFYKMLRKRGDSEENAISAICDQCGMEPEEVREILLSRS